MDEARRCTAKSKRSGEQCKRAAAVGASVCAMHGGKAPQVKDAAERREARKDAEKAVALYGLPRDIDPKQALEEELRRTLGHVGWLEQVIGAGKIQAEQSPTGRERTVKLDQATFAAGDQPSVWVDLYQRERKHLMDVIKTCAAIGIEERRIRVEEEQARWFAERQRLILEDLGLDPSAEKVQQAVRRRLTEASPVG